MSRLVTLFRSNFKPVIEQRFSITMGILSQPVAKEFIKYKDVTIQSLEFTIAQVEAKGSSDELPRMERKLPEINGALESFIKDVIKADGFITKRWSAFERLVLENDFLLRKDTQIHSSIQKTLEQERAHLLNFAIPQIMKDNNYVCIQWGGGNTFYSTSRSYINRAGSTFDALDKKFSAILKSVTDHINKQEHFIQERIRHQQQIQGQAQLVQVPTLPTLPTTHSPVTDPSQQLVIPPAGIPPAYSNDDIALIQTLRNEREQLMRLLEPKKS